MFALGNVLVSVLVLPSVFSTVSIVSNGGPRLDIRRFHRGRCRIAGGENMSALLFHFLDLIDNGGDDMVQLFALFFEKIANVQEGVAIEANLDEGRLHAWQHARYTAFVNASD